MKTLLITQCIQNDFVQPIGKYENMPNLLHVGYEESHRLMGLNTAEGPIALFMNWALKESKNALEIIHIRDWHDNNDPAQRKHLKQFGEHCLMNTIGAEFAFNFNENNNQQIVNSISLNDFVETGLIQLLEKYRGQNIRVGIIGVWTEAKVLFLSYELVSRFPEFEIAVCSALTASSSIHNHHTAIEQLKRILGIKVIYSIGEFSQFLTNDANTFTIPIPENEEFPSLAFNGECMVTETDRKIIKYLFRGSKDVQLKVLDNGYSGNLVLGTQSTDIAGHSEVAHVLKIGTQEEMGQERMAFEQIESVLGNNAPRIVDFADYNERGGIKYRYASMGSGSSKSFQELYMSGIPMSEVKDYLDTIFKDQLGRFYRSKTFESTNLLDYYFFDPHRAGQVKKWVENVYGKVKDGKPLTLPNGIEFPNVSDFYANDLEGLIKHSSSSSFFSYIHGDLNGGNVIIDAQKNVWMIDFFHTHRGHILKDLLKFENDLLYIFTPIKSEEDLNEALLISDVILNVKDLAQPLPDVSQTGLTNPDFIRTYETLKILRSYYPELIDFDRNPLQSFIGLLRYSLHTLIFFESNQYHKLWALYNSGHFGRLIKKHMEDAKPLRIDWLHFDKPIDGKVGLTILPGRKDFSRDLWADVEEIKRQGVSKIVNLISHDEYNYFGVNKLDEAYTKADFDVLHLPILDQMTPSLKEAHHCIDTISKWVKAGEKVMIHCAGGLGRSGLIAACYLKSIGYDSNTAIDIVRTSRSPRAIESKQQEEFVRNY